MKVYNRLTDWDKIVAIATILCFYILGICEDTFYIILMLSRKQVAFTVICTIYLFIKWINELELKKIYLYGFLLGLLTLFIMRLVCSISLNEIKLTSY